METKTPEAKQQQNKAFEKKVKKIQFAMKLAKRGMRNKSLLDKFCAFLMKRMTQNSPRKDFMVDELVDADLGFDPDELARYERGES